MTTTYIATIRHHSIGSAPEIEITGTLAQAKRAATARFGDGFQDHEIAIYRRLENFAHDGIKVASRLCGDRRWTDHLA